MADDEAGYVDSAFFFGFTFENNEEVLGIEWAEHQREEGFEHPCIDDGEWEAAYEERTGKPAAESPCTIERYSLCTYPIYCVAARGLFWDNAFCAETEIDPSKVVEDTAKLREQVAEFCEIMGLTFREPKWYLAH
jgi:hypothetical protein